LDHSIDESKYSKDYAVVGKRLPRVDAVAKVTGKFQCIADIQLPGMIYAKVMHSPYSHAKITKIDTSKAEEVPGVKCILTHLNTKKMHVNWHMGPPLDDVMHYQGEEVAVVAALTEKIALEAMKLIEVEYEILPSVYDSEEALKPDAPIVHPEYRSDNSFRGLPWIGLNRMDEDGYLRIEHGNYEKGKKEADVIVEGDNVTPIQFPISPAPRCCVVDWSSGDMLNAWIDSQTTQSQVPGLSAYLGIPQNKIRLMSHCIGAYGNKQPVKLLWFGALISKQTGRPVKLPYTREEDFIGTWRRVEFKTHMEMGVKKDGTISSFFTHCIANQGADSGFGFISMGTASVEAFTLLHKYNNSLCETAGAYTNITSYGAINGFGAPEGMYGAEKVADRAAEAIGMDPVEFYLKNVVKGGDDSMEMNQSFNGPKEIEWGVMGPDIDDFEEVIRKCAEESKWKEKWQGWGKPVSAEGPIRRGIGVATGMHHCTWNPSSAIVKMNMDGSAVVINNANEIGQGFATAITQVVAESLGISYEKVTAVTGDTGVGGFAFGNVASQGTTSHVYSSKRAADDARRKMFEWAAPKLGTTPDKLDAKNNFVFVKEDPEKKMPVAQICAANVQIFGTTTNPPQEKFFLDPNGKITSPYATACAIAEVEVDTETGIVRLTDLHSFDDVGVALNPDNCENQIDLGMCMAKGWILNEKVAIDKRNGAIMNPNMIDYKVSTILDMPDRHHYVGRIVEKPWPFGPYGGKGFSETACTATAPAIANAVYNAIGVRIDEGFLSPKVVLQAWNSREKER